MPQYPRAKSGEFSAAAIRFSKRLLAAADALDGVFRAAGFSDAGSAEVSNTSTASANCHSRRVRTIARILTGHRDHSPPARLPYPFPQPQAAPLDSQGCI